jgi:hypothetical protein
VGPTPSLVGHRRGFVARPKYTNQSFQQDFQVGFQVGSTKGSH